MPRTRETSRGSFLLAPGWLCWHALVLGIVVGMGWLGWWQLRRAEAGNTRSWAYTFEWPLLAVFVVIFWAKTVRDGIHPSPASPPGT
jgi:hypothetical protein